MVPDLFWLIFEELMKASDPSPESTHKHNVLPTVSRLDFSFSAYKSLILYHLDVFIYVILGGYFLIFFKKFYRSVVDLQCCVNFRCTAK